MYSQPLSPGIWRTLLTATIVPDMYSSSLDKPSRSIEDLRATKSPFSRNKSLLYPT